MDRIAIKENARKMINGNLWYLWKPMLFIIIPMIVLMLVGIGIDASIGADGRPFYSLFSSIGSIIASIFYVGYAYYCLGFVRGQRMDAKEVFEFTKKHWIIALLSALLVGLNVGIGMILLIVPGVIAALGLSLYTYVVADNPELPATDALRKCWEITNGYKVDLLVFFLSFIGWLILVALTFGILVIWVAPYMTIAETLVYETLKK